MQSYSNGKTTLQLWQCLLHQTLNTLYGYSQTTFYYPQVLNAKLDQCAGGPFLCFVMLQKPEKLCQYICSITNLLLSLSLLELTLDKKGDNYYNTVYVKYHKDGQFCIKFGVVDPLFTSNLSGRIFQILCASQNVQTLRHISAYFGVIFRIVQNTLALRNQYRESPDSTVFWEILNRVN